MSAKDAFLKKVTPYILLGNGVAKLGSGLNGTFQGFMYVKNTAVGQVNIQIPNIKLWGGNLK